MLIDGLGLFGRSIVFNAVTEDFEASGIPRVELIRHNCAATLGRVNNTVGVMVGQSFVKTYFFQLDPPGSREWEEFSTNWAYLGPVLGRASSNEMVLGESPRNEVFTNLSLSWENRAYMGSFPTYGRSTQVPASWFKAGLLQ